MDALSKLAAMRTQAAAADIEAQLTVTSGQRPILVMLQMAKRDASDAIALLATVDPEDPKKIRELQNLVARFDDLCRWLRDVVDAGDEASALITAEDTAEVIDLLSQTEEGQRDLVAMGIIGEQDATR